jgi:hypothetical protein
VVFADGDCNLVDRDSLCKPAYIDPRQQGGVY